MKVVQCWDDGVVDDIRLIEILRRHGAKASFNLNIGLHEETRREGGKFQNVKTVYRLARSELLHVYDGFLIANHTVNHPHLEQIPIVEAKREIAEGRDRLEQLFGYAVKGFAYPYGTYNAAVEEAVREAGHLYARTVVSVADIFPNDNPMAFHANCHFLAKDFWERFEHVKATNGTFYFWGHSYELCTDEQWREFDEKIARISREAEWAALPDLFS